MIQHLPRRVTRIATEYQSVLPSGRALFYYHFAPLMAVNRALRRTSGGGKERTENMALFKRKDLENKGLNEDQIAYIMTESGRALSADYMPKSSLQEEIEKAKQEWQKNAPSVDVTKTEEYIKLAGENDMLRTTASEDFARVKPKFRETVYSKLNRAQDAPPVADQLQEIAKGFEEYFIPDAQPAKNTPVYSQKPPKPSANSAEDAEVAKVLENW